MGNNHIDSRNNKLLIDIQPNIGLENDVRISIIELLNIILADEAVLTIKTRTAYWNIRGADIIEYQKLFETQYESLNHISDEIAERVRVMGGYAIGSLAEFLKVTRVEEQPGIVPDILRLLADQEAITRNLRSDARKCTEEYEDEGTFELLVSTLRLHEKMAWLLRSLIQPELANSGSRGV
ncbi:MAG: DNA starvation/stationary phase protection protein [Anaerolineaceae bacterium]|nr:DNA starvation/stationary phase protection protein [Anaerolineaceae bacterium]